MGSQDAMLKAMHTMTGDDIVRGRFVGYRKEPGVAAGSKAETFAALKLQIDSWR